MILDSGKLNLIQCFSIGKKVLCSEGKKKMYFGTSSQILVFDWHGIRLLTYPLEVNFIPGTLL